MEEIEPMMAEISGGEELGDDFYEKIEAPKFVDLTAPDLRPVDDDRYWFCLRVGCDQRHEEEMESEEIYKNFVLRVMAARSPSVHLRRALCRKESSTHLKCPRTVPTKSSKSRVSRLAMISSISQKTTDNAKPKARQIIPRQNYPTPNAKAKQSSAAAKSFTTPKNKHKRLSNPGTFRSVRNPKTTTILVPKERVVAKALVFHSPKKAVKVKRSVELSTSVKKICEGMKKLEITNKKNVLGYSHKPLPSDMYKKQFRGREVKSRVFDSLHSRSQKHENAMSPKSLKKRAKGKEEFKVCLDPVAHERIVHETSGMEVDEKSRVFSPDVPSTAGNSMSVKNSGYKELPSENKSKGFSDASKSEDINTNEEVNDLELKLKPRSEEKEELAAIESGLDKVNQNEVTEIYDKENALDADDNEKENALGVEDKIDEVESAGKENTSGSDNNRKLDLTTDHLDKKKALGKKEICKATQKVTKKVGKISNGRTTSTVTDAQGARYTKPKPTNPKPFRLRTDERRILKEANTEKMQLFASAKEMTSVLECGGNSETKHPSASEQGITSCSKTLKGPSTTLLRPNNASKCRKTKPEASKPEESMARIKRLVRKQTIISSGVASCRKKRVPITTPTKQLGAVKETSPEIKASVSAASGPPSYGRRPVTVPKEPKFHSVHIPKSCTRRVAQGVS